jgi:UDP-N-acetylmuramate--alanine ligase
VTAGDEAGTAARDLAPSFVLDLSSPRRVHVVGVGGAGMSGVATLLAGRGHTVTGSDLRDVPVLARLRAGGIEARAGQGADRVPAGVDAVVVSTAIPSTNPEVVAARARGVPVLRRADALAALTAISRTVAVSGTHGKTTTTAMVTRILRAAGWRPSFLIGGDVPELGAGAAHDDGDWLVVEADESDGTFVELVAEAVVVTNVEADHLDHHGSLDAIEAGFARFLAAAPGPRVACADDAGARRAVARAGVPVTTYGVAPDADVRIVARRVVPGGSELDVVLADGRAVAVHLAVPGAHNAANATAALAVSVALGVDPAVACQALAGFGGVARRFTHRGEVGGVTLVDDYAHLPAEVRATLATAREGTWSRVVAVFQPHRYSRTQALWQDFGDAFDDADVLVLTDVDPAGEAPRPGVSGRLLLQAVLDRRPHSLVAYVSHRADLAAHVRDLARPGDVVLSLGAGDVTALADEWRALDRDGAP